MPGADIEDVILGDTNQAGEDSRNVARNALLLAGLPVTVPGQTVNRLCASGLGAVIDSARAITCGEGELYIAGGVESMSRAPFVMGKAESAYSRDAKFMTPPLALAFQIKIIAQYGGHSMPETGDNVAADFGISREQADLFAAQSQAKYQKPKKKVSLPMKLHQLRFSKAKIAPKLVSEDEHPRPSSTVEALTKLKPLFEGGVVTAGNASGINDGAAALLIGSEAAGQKYGLKPMAKILSAAAAGIEPRIMGAGPIEAIKKRLHVLALL